MVPRLSKYVRLEDAELVSRTLAGERRAFSELVRRHQGVVFRVCYRVLGDREDAKDAAQEAFVRAYNRLQTFRGDSAFRTWLLKLTTNVSLNERGRRRDDPPTEVPEVDPSRGPEEQAIAAGEASRLHDALGHLQQNHRAAVVLRDLEGLTYPEVAESLGVPEGTAKGWAHRGRQRLKDLLV